MKTVIITGVTGAVGMAAAQAIARTANVRLVLVGRDLGKLEDVRMTLDAKTATDIVQGDLSDTSSVKQLVSTLRAKYPSVDALVNVAAVYKAQKVMTRQNHETMLATNHLAPFALTLGLLPCLKQVKGSKVLTVAAPSSTRIDFDNWNSSKKFASLNVFSATKMMNLLFAFALARELKGSGHASMAFHPGLVKSSLLKEGPGFLKAMFNLISSSPGKTGQAIARLVLEGDANAQNGKFYNNQLKEMKAAAPAYDETIQRELWKRSELAVASA